MPYVRRGRARMWRVEGLYARLAKRKVVRTRKGRTNIGSGRRIVSVKQVVGSGADIEDLGP